MAVVFVEGFDTYNGTGNTLTAPGVLTRWSGSGLTPATGRFGGQSVYGNNPNRVAMAQLPGTYTSGCIGTALFVTGGNGGPASYGLFGVAATPYSSVNAMGGQGQFYITMDSGPNICVYRGTTLLATSPTTITTNVWHYVEVEFVISDTVGEVRVYLDNNSTPIINLSGIDTKYQTENGFSYIGLSGFSVSVGYMDDMYITDTPNRLGEQRVLTTYVDADSTPSEWSTSAGGSTAPYTMLDETLCDGDTTYIYSGVAGRAAVFSTQNPSVVPTSVNAVQVGGYARKTDTGVRGVQLQYVDGAGSTFNSSEFTLSGGYVRQISLYGTNPGTGLPWTAAELNAMRIGVRVST